MNQIQLIPNEFGVFALFYFMYLMVQQVILVPQSPELQLLFIFSSCLCGFPPDIQSFLLPHKIPASIGLVTLMPCDKMASCPNLLQL